MNEMPTFSEEKNYLKLIKTLTKICEANKGTSAGADDRFLAAEGLYKKFSGHATSALYLFRSTTLDDLKVADKWVSFFDTASIHVLGRAALEAFLVFHYVFIAPKSDDEKNFRYYSWLLASCLEKQKFQAQSKEGKNQLENEKKIIEELKKKLEANNAFLNLTEKQRKNLLGKGRINNDWKVQSWREIGISAGLSGIITKQFYSYLCGYAHSGHQSAQQVGGAEKAETQKALCVATMTLIMIAMANMIRSYCELFDNSKTVLQKDKDALSNVNQWIEIGMS